MDVNRSSADGHRTPKPPEFDSSSRLNEVAANKINSLPINSAHIV